MHEIKPTFDTDWGEEIALRCPKCEDFYMHHGAVDVAQRPREDEPGLSRIVIGSDGTTITRLPGGYRGRRQEVVIEFQCEQCGEIGRLVIRQHKGVTLLVWEVEEASDAALGG